MRPHGICSLYKISVKLHIVINERTNIREFFAVSYKNKSVILCQMRCKRVDSALQRSLVARAYGRSCTSNKIYVPKP